MNLTDSKSARILAGLIGLVSTCILSSGCGSNPRVQGGSQTLNPVQAQAVVEAGLPGARIYFAHPNFYTLTQPNTEGNCAGDAKTYFDPVGSLGPTVPLPLAINESDSTTTIKPLFIKNISVDQTDANTPVSTNLAFSCSFGGTGAPAPSSCATFDYAAAGGLSTTLAGNLLLIGGIQSVNYTGLQSVSPVPRGLTLSCGSIGVQSPVAGQPGVPFGTTECDASMYALAVDTLSANTATNPPNPLAPGLTSANGPISSWANISAVPGYGGPQGAAGASVAYDSQLNTLAVFGGVSPLSGTAPFGTSSPTNNTWSFDLSSQRWTLLNANSVVDAVILREIDNNQGFAKQLPKSISPRAVAGFAAVPGMAVDLMSTTGTVTAANSDSTERLVTAGGLDANGFESDVYKFNPTFGPEWVDLQGVVAAGSGLLSQYLDSYHTQVLYNAVTAPGGGLLQDFFWTTQNPPVYDVNTLGVTVRTNPVNFGFMGLASTASGAGYLFSVGGFDGQVDTTGKQIRPVNVGTDCPLPTGHCAMNLGSKTGGVAGETISANFAGVSNSESTGLSAAPTIWTQHDAVPGGVTGVPWYGGVTLLPGLSLATHDAVYFGGSNCTGYLTNPSGCLFTNPGIYWTNVLNPTPTTYVPTQVAVPGAPANAGMAAARGSWEPNLALVVAFGGINGGATPDQLIHYLYRNSGTGLPTWASTTPAGAAPAVVANGTMVFSHITGKFYLFGGYNFTFSTTLSDTWELSISNPSCAIAAAASCTFTWRQLDVPNGLSCFPTACPVARRSQRMAEVNYINRNPVADPNCLSGATPCSFGIFMEGGTPDGVTFLPDRWMFDPTANNGFGQWIKVNDFPPRSLAMMSTADFTILPQNTNAHYAVLFGGETALQNPMDSQSTGGAHFNVAPTLGDTWIFDFGTSTWNRVNLLGQGYAQAGGTPVPGATELVRRQSFAAQTGGTPAELSPPPIAGGMMVARTLNSGTLLNIPEVFLFGGRLKDGSLLPLNRIYKFCAGSTGESYGLPGSTGTITAISATNPTTITSAAHGLVSGDQVIISGSNSTPSVDGTYTITVTGVNTFTIQVNVSTPGTTGIWALTPAPPPSPTNVSIPSATDFSCDSYDQNLNPYSPNPQAGYVGRWLRKLPLQAAGDVNPAVVGMYMGAAVYDSRNDRIIEFGGLNSLTGGGTLSTITDSTNRAATNTLYEYAFPSTAAPNGVWHQILACGGSTTPPARYGHSLSYDALNRQLVVVGGFNSAGTPLTQTQTYYDGRTFSIPEVWRATRDNVQNCYDWSQVTLFGNSIDVASQTPPFSGLSSAAAIFIPSGGFNTGFYSMYDSACNAEGPIANSDPAISKLLAGGAYFDIDRTQLGPNENLILNLTWMPLGMGNQNPDGSTMSTNDNSVFRIHLVKTGQSQTQLETIEQPRYLTYTGTTQFPEIVQSLSILPPPYGQIHEEQIVLPISADPGIDRIRLERYSGSGVLIDATLYRMGYR